MNRWGSPQARHTDYTDCWDHHLNFPILSGKQVFLIKPGLDTMRVFKLIIQTSAAVAMLILVMAAPGVLLASQNPITVLAVTLSPTRVSGRSSTSGNTVTLSAPAPAGGVRVPLGSSSDLAAVPASVAVAQGQTVSVRFTIATLNVGIDTTISISATYGSVTKKANLTILKVSNFSQAPLIDYQSGQMYLGIYPGRLYKGSNTPPADHDAVGQLAAAGVQPLDYYGNADPMSTI